MAQEDSNLEKEVATLNDDISQLDSDIREFKKILRTVNAAQSKASDKNELQNIERELETL